MTKANALLLFLLSFISWGASAQEDAVTKTTDSIVAEGRRLYRREMASWYGTDLFLEAYTNRDNIGGYFSYTDGALARCVFFSRADQPTVIGSITFDSTYNTRTAKVDLAERPFSSEERALHGIRQATLDLMQSDTLFQSYSNTSFNLIPLIDGADRKVYVLTGPKREGLVVFGNDYLVRFDGNNAVTGKRRLHRNIIPIEVAGKDGTEVESTMHAHLPETGDFITATDVCTLMLYGRFTKWKQHSVFSKNYLNIWNVQTNELFVMTMEALERINEDQKKRHPKQ
ncbi:MAG: hypothetical protein EOO12_07810 [Chitinophagaceae bacterium]|nr:MAG: hypothetical protein EOO12_07810 [Chitinophagaceae bacterium]